MKIGIIAATPAGSRVDALRGTGDLSGKTVVGIADPLNSDLSGITVGLTTSFAEEVAEVVPGARIVKAFNTTFAGVVADAPEFQGGRKASVFIAGDGSVAKAKAADRLPAWASRRGRAALSAIRGISRVPGS